jgi:hypothetical protein
VCVAVGSCRCYRHRTAACEGILSSNRQRLTDARGRRSVPQLRLHHTYHMQMRDLFRILHQSLLGDVSWSWTDFLRFRVSTALPQEQSGQ